MAQHALELIVIGEDDPSQVALVDPQTGEAVALGDASAELLASVLRNVQIDLMVLGDAKRWLGREMINRMDRSAEWTVRARGVEVTSSSPKPKTDWDVEILVPILDALVAEGVITPEARLKACGQSFEWKPLARGLAALCKLPGVAERLAPARKSIEQTRGVRITVL